MRILQPETVPAKPPLVIEMTEQEARAIKNTLDGAVFAGAFSCGHPAAVEMGRLLDRYLR